MINISVIIPCFNVEEELLSRCLNSIFAQTYNNFEVILVDDGSECTYKKIIRKTETLDKRIKLFEQTNKGVSAARNRGIKEAEGIYIVFVDADDVLVPYFFSEAVRICQRTNADFLIGGNTLLSNKKYNKDDFCNSEVQIEKLTHKKIEKFKAHMVGELIYFGDCGGYFGRGPWTRFVKREIAVAHLFDEELHMGEDIVWNLQMLEQCEQIYIAYRIWYLYYININSATHKYNEKMLDNVRNELPCIESLLNLLDEDQFAGYCSHIIDELRKIYECYLGKRECNLSIQQRKKVIHELYTEFPWKHAGSARYRKQASKRYKIKSILYKSRCWFLFLKFRIIMRKFFQLIKELKILKKV